MQNKNMLISIVVPFYRIKDNVIADTVNSILAQTYTNFEAWLVDDGNTDNTAEILDSYALKDKRIKVIHQKNLGVSAARNNGMRNAQGEYIVFVDGDDVLAPYGLEAIVEEIVTLEPDIIYAEHVVFHDNCQFPEFLSEKAYKIDEKKTVMKSMISSNASKKMGFHGAPWGKAYRRCFLTENNLYFDENLPRSQDNEFNFRTLQFTSNIAYLPVKVYGYRESAQSAMTRYRKDSQTIQERYLDAIIADATEFSVLNVVEHDIQVITVRKFFDICNTCILHQDNRDSFSKKLAAIKKMMKSPRYKNALKNVSVSDFPGAGKLYVLLLKAHCYILYCAAHFMRRKLKGLK